LSFWENVVILLPVTILQLPKYGTFTERFLVTLTFS